MLIPRLIELLNGRQAGVRSAMVSALARLAGHGELVVACYPDIANTVMKPNFARKLGQPFHGSLPCYMTLSLGFDYLWFLHLPSLLIMVSL
jgi:hypothetical protein